MLNLLRSRHTWLFPLLALVALLLFLVDLATGSVYIPLPEVARILTGGEAEQSNWHDIVLLFRMPHGLTALLAGVGLAMSGLQMQTLFRNPLAGPFVLGISSGASLGVALLVLGSGWVAGVLGMGTFLSGDLGVALAASAGAIGILLLILLMARKVVDNVTLLIVGLMLGYLASAIVSILMYFGQAEEVQTFVIWTLGSFSEVTRSQLGILASLVGVGLLISFILSKWLNALLLGDDYARSIGIPVQKARRWIIISTGIMAGSITAFCGPIAFLGIAIPHLTRALFNTSNHRVLVPAVLLVGAITALACGIFAQLPGMQQTLPINAVTSLIGAPVVLWVVLSMKNLRSTFAG